jgi:hypothetical protein
MGHQEMDGASRNGWGIKKWIRHQGMGGRGIDIDA